MNRAERHKAMRRLEAARRRRREIAEELSDAELHDDDQEYKFLSDALYDAERDVELAEAEFPEVVYWPRA